MSVRVWFYNPQQDRTTSYNFINKIVAGLTPPFCHVELQFPDGDACSIVMHDTVRMRKRTFDEEYYTCVSIPSTALALQYTVILESLQRSTFYPRPRRPHAAPPSAQASRGVSQLHAPHSSPHHTQRA